MTPSQYPYRFFAVMGFGIYLFAVVAFGTFAKVSAKGGSVARALNEQAQFLLTQPTAAAFLLLPFLLLGAIGGWVACRKGFSRAVGVFLLGVLLLLFVYFKGYQGAEISLAERKWTAAALSLGMIPFFSVPALAICAVVGLVVPKGPQTQ